MNSFSSDDPIGFDEAVKHVAGRLLADNVQRGVLAAEVLDLGSTIAAHELSALHASGDYIEFGNRLQSAMEAQAKENAKKTVSNWDELQVRRWRDRQRPMPYDDVAA